MQLVSATGNFYLYYLFIDLYKALRPLYRGLRKTVPKTSFLSAKTPLPPLAEQRAIVAFLDRETSKIDDLIAKKVRLIELLQEQRSAIISHAVTKGLDPDVPMKDSGVDWLGDIPAHWSATKLSRLCKSIRDGTHNPPPRNSGEHRLLSVRNIIDGEFVLREDDRTMLAEDFEELQRSYTVEENDVLIAIVGATTGKSAVAGNLDNVTVQRSLAILRPDFSRLRSHFLNYWLQSSVIQNEIYRIMDKYAAQPGIYLLDVAKLPIVVVPTNDQDVIIDYLDNASARLNQLILTTRLTIEHLREFRTSLISAAVTGKIDVRGEVESDG